jgi:hypothetical protein
MTPRAILLCVLPLSALCGAGAFLGTFLLSASLIPPRTTYAGRQAVYVFWGAWRPDPHGDPRGLPPDSPMPTQVQAALRAVLEDAQFLAAVRAGKTREPSDILADVRAGRDVQPSDERSLGLRFFYRDFPGGVPGPPPRDWISSRASLEFDPEDPQLCYLVVRDADGVEAGVAAAWLGREFQPYADRAVRPLIDFDPARPDARVFLGAHRQYRNEIDDRLPDRLRLALSAAALAAAATVGAGEAIKRRRQRAESAIPESLVSRPHSHDDPAPAPAVVAPDGVQDFPPPAPRAAP